MNYIQQLKKGQKLLSLIKNSALLLLYTVVIISFFSCEEKKEPPVNLVVSADSADKIDRQILFNYAKQKIAENVKDIEYGVFESDSAKGLVVGREFMTEKEWGIKFYYLKFVNSNPEKIFETPLLKGSLNESLLKRFKMANYKYELFYYDSQDYFLGSGGGEIFSYLIDLNTKEIFYAHFYTVEDKPLSLYLSSNINRSEIRDFFTKNFQRDYPNLVVVSRDYNLDEGR